MIEIGETAFYIVIRYVAFLESKGFSGCCKAIQQGKEWKSRELAEAHCMEIVSQGFRIDHSEYLSEFIPSHRIISVELLQKRGKKNAHATSG